MTVRKAGVVAVGYTAAGAVVAVVAVAIAAAEAAEAVAAAVADIAAVAAVAVAVAIAIAAVTKPRSVTNSSKGARQGRPFLCVGWSEADQINSAAISSARRRPRSVRRTRGP